MKFRVDIGIGVTGGPQAVGQARQAATQIADAIRRAVVPGNIGQLGQQIAAGIAEANFSALTTSVSAALRAGINPAVISAAFNGISIPGLTQAVSAALAGVDAGNLATRISQAIGRVNLAQLTTAISNAIRQGLNPTVIRSALSRIDFSGLTSAITAAVTRAFSPANMSRLATQLQSAFQRINLSQLLGQLGQVEQVLRRVVGLARQINFNNIGGQQLAGLIRQLADLEERLRRLEGASRGAGSGMGAFGGSFASVIAGALSLTAIMAGLGKAVESSLSYGSMQRGFAAVAGSAEGGAREMAFVRAEADRLGLELQSVSGDWLKMAAAAKGTSLEGQKSREVFSSIANASRVLGLDSQKTSLALNALSQMISKGTVSAEELKGQLGDALPGAFQIAARAAGVTTGEFMEMLANGDVLATDLLPKLAAELQKTYGAAASAAGQDPAAQFGRMKTAIFDAQVALGNAFVPALAEAAIAAANFFKSSDFIAFAQSVGQSISFVIRALVSLGDFLSESGIRFRLLRAVAAESTADLIDLAAGASKAWMAFVDGLLQGVEFFARFKNLPTGPIEELRKTLAGAVAENDRLARELSGGFRDVADEQIRLQAESDATRKSLLDLGKAVDTLVGAGGGGGGGKLTALEKRLGTVTDNLREQIEALEATLRAYAATYGKMPVFDKVLLTHAERLEALFKAEKKIADLKLDANGEKAAEIRLLEAEAARLNKQLEMTAAYAKWFEKRPIIGAENISSVTLPTLQEIKPEGVGFVSGIDPRAPDSMWPEIEQVITDLADRMGQEFSSVLDGMLDKWIDFGNSWVANLGESLAKMFASAMIKSAISGMLTSVSGGGGFWGQVAGALTGSQGGGGVDWGQLAGAVSGLWKAYKSVGSVSGAFTSWNAARTGLYGPTAAGGNIAGSGGGGWFSGAGGTALATAGITAALTAAIAAYAKHRSDKERVGLGAEIVFVPNRDMTPAPMPPGGLPNGGVGGGGAGGGMQTAAAASSLVKAADALAAAVKGGTVQVRGSLTIGDGTQLDPIEKELQAFFKGIETATNSVLTGFDKIKIAYTNGKDIIVTTADGLEKKFTDLGEAMDYASVKMLSSATFEGIGENVAAVLKRAESIGLENLEEAMAAAQAADEALAGAVGKTAPAVGQFALQIKEMEQALAAESEKMRQWGISEAGVQALQEKRLDQLRREQEALGSEAVVSVLEKLFELSPQAAADAELAQLYTEAAGAIRIAQFAMEVEALRGLGYLTAAQMDLIDRYLAAVEAAGPAAAGATYGGGPSGPDPGQEQRANRRKEIYRQLGEWEGIYAAANDNLGKALEGVRNMAQEALDIGMGDAYSAKILREGGKAAAREFMKPFEAIVSGSGKLAARGQWEAIGEKYDAFEASVLAGADQLAAAGVDVEAMLAQLAAAERAEIEALGRSLLDTFGVPAIQARTAMDDLAARLQLVADMASAGAISAEDAAAVFRHAAEQAFLGLGDSLLGFVDRYYGEVEGAEALRIQMQQMRFDLELAQLELQFRLVQGMNLLTAEQVAQIEGLFGYIREHPPTFTAPTTPAANDNGIPGYGGSAANDNGVDQAARDLERLMQLLRGWEDLALSPAERRLRDINEQFDEMLRLAAGNAALIARSQAAYDLAIRDFYDGLRQPLRDLLADLTGGPASGNARGRITDLFAQYQGLVAQLRANPNDIAATEQLNAIARQLLDVGGAYGEDSPLLAGIRAALMRDLPGILDGEDAQLSREGLGSAPADVASSIKSGADRQVSELVQLRAEVAGLRRDLASQQSRETEKTGKLNRAVNQLQESVRRKLA